MMERSEHLVPLKAKLWSDNSNPIWLASSLKLYRNISNYCFPFKLDQEEGHQLLNLLSKSILKLDSLLHPHFLNFRNIDPVGKEFLYEHFLSIPSYSEGGQNEGCIFDDNGKVIFLINIKDHLQIQKIDTSSNIESCFNEMVLIENEIGKAFDFAYSARFGFLTSNLRKCGTGFELRVYLHLPMLIQLKKIDEVIKNEVDDMILIDALRGQRESFEADIVILQNRSTIGLSEEEIIKTVSDAAFKLIAQEKTLRSHLEKDDEMHIKNLVSRAYALAFHSYEFETLEALNTISLCKLGIDLGWIEGLNHQILNELLFHVQRGHLLVSFNDLKQEEISHKRAEILHKTFKMSKLLI
jgi:protein arginine kinase